MDTTRAYEPNARILRPLLAAPTALTAFSIDMSRGVRVVFAAGLCMVLAVWLGVGGGPGSWCR